MNEKLQQIIQQHLSKEQQDEMQDFLLDLDKNFPVSQGKDNFPDSHQLFSIINSIREVIFQTDTKGKLSYLSPAWEQITGFAITKSLGKHFLEFVHPEDQEKAQTLFKPIREITKNADIVTIRCKTKNNTYTFVEISITLTFENNGKVSGASGTLHDISDRKKAEYEIFQSEQKFRSLFENSSDPHMLVGNDGLIECNNATLELLEAHSKEQLIGIQPSLLSPEIQPDGTSSVEKALEADDLARKNGFHRFDWIHKKFNGELIPVEVSLTYIHLGNNPILLAVWHDLTERKNFEEQLITAKEQAESASSAKAQFLSTMSHEIRTPMNAVIGITHLLLENNPREDQITNLNTLKFSAENLLVLINDILDFSKIEAGKIEWENVDFNLTELIKSIKHSLAYKAQEKGIKLRIRKDDMLPTFIKGDPTRLSQILTNLMSNAVKFTNKGSVIIDIDVESEQDNQILLNFSVTDTGIGIAADKIDMIFDSFSQANTKVTRKYGGTGLGLAITKRLLEMQGSKIEVESKLGKGTKFHFQLAFDCSTKQLQNAEPIVKHPNKFTSLKNTKILLVEDNPINVLVATQFLKKWDVSYLVAENGAVALEMIAKETFDMILMDLQMPIMDGFEATKQIRAMGGSMEQLPIIAITASVMMQVREEVLKAGMTDYISKPFNPNEFHAKIKKYAKKS